MTPADSSLTIAGGKLQTLTAGTGHPLLVLHHDIGNPGWLPFYDDLARDFTVHVPSHPGFGKSERLDWMRSVRDLAMIYEWLLADQKLDRVSVVGLGFGGWVAAEMAVMCHHNLDHLVLVGPMGLQPKKGEIFDQFLVDTIHYVKTGFADDRHYATLYQAEPTLDQLEQWEINREMTSRIAYKPNMYDQQLPHLLPGIQTPTLIVAGADDLIVPAACAEQYRDGIGGAQLVSVSGAGHYVEVEQPSALAKLVREFIGR